MSFCSYVFFWQIFNDWLLLKFVIWSDSVWDIFLSISEIFLSFSVTFFFDCDKIIFPEMPSVCSVLKFDPPVTFLLAFGLNMTYYLSVKVFSKLMNHYRQCGVIQHFSTGQNLLKKISRKDKYWHNQLKSYFIDPEHK